VDVVLRAESLGQPASLPSKEHAAPVPECSA
jgi:hypothetical protein